MLWKQDACPAGMDRGFVRSPPCGRNPRDDLVTRPGSRAYQISERSQDCVKYGADKAISYLCSGDLLGSSHPLPSEFSRNEVRSANQLPRRSYRVDETHRGATAAPCSCSLWRSTVRPYPPPTASLMAGRASPHPHERHVSCFLLCCPVSHALSFRDRAFASGYPHACSGHILPADLTSFKAHGRNGRRKPREIAGIWPYCFPLEPERGFRDLGHERGWQQRPPVDP